MSSAMIPSNVEMVYTIPFVNIDIEAAKVYAIPKRYGKVRGKPPILVPRAAYKLINKKTELKITQKLPVFEYLLIEV